MTTQRRTTYKRNDGLENLLNKLNGLLEPVENDILKNYIKPKYPIILLVGCARSGSTLFIQWLANTNKFTVPTNLLSRFYKAPYIGALIQEILTNPDYNFKDELSDFNKEVNFISDLGKTIGHLSPNEFYYFWRNFFKFGEIQILDKQNLNKINKRKFISEIAAIESVTNKPLCLKALIVNWNIPFMSSLFEKALFIHIKRDPNFNAQSLIEARIKFYGSINSWYSFKPPEYNLLKDYDPFTQVSGQVYYTNKAIEEGLDEIADKKKLVVTYEDLCKDPESVYIKIRSKLYELGYNLDQTYPGPKSFEISNEIKLKQSEFDKIHKAYYKLSNP